MAYTAKDPCPPRRFLYLRETKSWWCEKEGGGGEGGEEKVSMLTASGVGPVVSMILKNVYFSPYANK